MVAGAFNPEWMGKVVEIRVPLQMPDGTTYPVKRRGAVVETYRDSDSDWILVDTPLGRIWHRAPMGVRVFPLESR